MAKRKRPAWRASWKGQLRFGLVSLTVEAVNARSSEEGDIHFHQLHRKCLNRIHYQKMCPVHGKIDNDEIVLGYETGRDQYIEVDPEELESLRTEKEKAFNIESVIEPDELDPIYFDGRMYYLLPAAAENQESFDVLATALERTGKWGVGHLVMSGKDQIAAVRSKDGLMHMAVLNFPAEIRAAQELSKSRSRAATPRKVKLAETLLKSFNVHKFKFSDYEDRYRHRLADLLEAKIAGNQVSRPEGSDDVPVINLMEALKQSLKSKGAATKTRRPRRIPKKRRRKAS
jgi:DNA end-binding protein Ku